MSLIHPRYFLRHSCGAYYLGFVEGAFPFTLRMWWHIPATDAPPMPDEGCVLCQRPLKHHQALVIAGYALHKSCAQRGLIPGDLAREIKKTGTLVANKGMKPA